MTWPSKDDESVVKKAFKSVIFSMIGWGELDKYGHTLSFEKLA
jgi:hypothetical protein